MGILSWLTRRHSPQAPWVNFAGPAFKATAYPFYARLRAEAPVYQVTVQGRQTAWLITRYDDVAAVLKDERLAKDKLNALTPCQIARQPWLPAFFRPLTRSVVAVDPPHHTRLRALVLKAFTPRLIEQMRPRMEELTNTFLDAVQDKGCMDLIRDYALPLPTTIVADMLGIPAEDHPRIHRWANALLESGPFLSGWRLLRVIPPVWQIMSYLRGHIRMRRARPRDDLLGALAQAEEAGEKLSEDEVVGMALLLVVAGYETTVNLIGKGMLALLENPEQMARLRDEALIRPAIEELLRYYSPTEVATERYAREDIRIGGVTIPQGSLVYAVLDSANRDERQFPNPDTLDLSREPNRHLTFGHGIHFCLGAPLSRLEGQIAIRTLLRRMPDLRLSVPRNALRWRPGQMLRGLEALPLTFARRPGATFVRAASGKNTWPPPASQRRRKG
jgi:cytochrome P450 PksS